MLANDFSAAVVVRSRANNADGIIEKSDVSASPSTAVTNRCFALTHDWGAILP